MAKAARSVRVIVPPLAIVLTLRPGAVDRERKSDGETRQGVAVRSVRTTVVTLEDRCSCHAAMNSPRGVTAMSELPGFSERYPHQLSGGQQQRVALARVLAVEPVLLLLDEPFGALDKKLRVEMQLEVKQLVALLGMTTIFVTHDQEEAMRMSDRVAIMHAGRIVQCDAPAAIYDRPRDLFVADFIGNSNLLDAKLLGGGGDGLRVVAAGVELELPRDA